MSELEKRVEQMQNEIDELKREVEDLQASHYVEEKGSSGWYWVLVPMMALSIPIIAILSN